MSSNAKADKSAMLTTKQLEHVRLFEERRSEVKSIVSLLNATNAPFVCQHEDYLKAFKKKRMASLVKVKSDSDNVVIEYAGDTTDGFSVSIVRRGNFIFLGYSEREMEANYGAKLVAAYNSEFYKDTVPDLTEIVKILGCKMPKAFFDF